MPSPFRHRNLPLMLLQAREAVISHFRPILTAHGLTEQQWRILRLLDERGPLESWQVARECQMLKPSLTGVLTRLEQTGLVGRERPDADQRRLVVTITATGQALVRRLAPLIEARYAAIEASVGRDLVADLYAALDRLLAANAAAAAGAEEAAAG